MTKFSYLTVFILVSFVSFPFRLEAAFSPFNSLGRQKKTFLGPNPKQETWITRAKFRVWGRRFFACIIMLHQCQKHTKFNAVWMSICTMHNVKGGTWNWASLFFLKCHNTLEALRTFFVLDLMGLLWRFAYNDFLLRKQFEEGLQKKYLFHEMHSRNLNSIIKLKLSFVNLFTDKKFTHGVDANFLHHWHQLY